MSQSSSNLLARKWFEEHIRMAYWIGRHWAARLLDLHGVDYTADDLEEFSQDAVCRGFDRFAKVVGKVRGKDRRQWVGRCMVRAVRDAVRSRSTWGGVSSPAAVRDDAMARFKRVRPMGRHGRDDEREYLDVEYKPMEHPVQRWEVEELVNAWLPEHLRPTATYAAMGISQAASALLQGVTDRTVRNRLREIREYLDPSLSLYGMIFCWLEAARQDRAWTTASA